LVGDARAIGAGVEIAVPVLEVGFVGEESLDLGASPLGSDTDEVAEVIVGRRHGIEQQRLDHDFLRVVFAAEQRAINSRRDNDRSRRGRSFR
jgi:hypothetical protein